MHCAIWYHQYNFKNVKKPDGGVLLLVTKSNTPPWVSFTFFNCTNGTKLRNASNILGQIVQAQSIERLKLALHKKESFPFSRISLVNVTKSIAVVNVKKCGNCSLVTFTEEILNGKLQFLCSIAKAYLGSSQV